MVVVVVVISIPHTHTEKNFFFIDDISIDGKRERKKKGGKIVINFANGCYIYGHATT